MKTVSMSGSLRENVGKKDAKKVRREGKVPCVLYGGKEQVHFSIDAKEFSKIIFTPEVFILEIKIKDNSYKAILQDVQYHPVTDVVLHADLLEVIPNKPLIIGLPVKLTGTAPGIMSGGKLRKRLGRLLVKGLADDLPECIELSIAGLELNDSIKVNEVSYANLEFLDPSSAEIVGVKTARGAGMGDEPEEEEEEGGEEGAEGEETPAEGEGAAEEKTEGKDS